MLNTYAKGRRVIRALARREDIATGPGCLALVLLTCAVIAVSAVGDAPARRADGLTIVGDAVETASPRARIVFARYSDFGAWDLFVARSDGSGERRLTRTKTRGLEPAVSPNGRRIAFVREAHDPMFGQSGGDIWVMNVDGTQQRRLTRSGADSDPAWSADGAFIFFARWGTIVTRIYRMRADGSQVRRLTDPEPSYERACDYGPAPSPDGRVAFSRTDACIRGGSGSIAAVDMRGRPVPVMQDFEVGWAYDPDWSPDGRLLAFAACDVHDGEPSGIYVASPDGSAARRISRDCHSSEPSWSPDGRWLVFVRRVGYGDSNPGEIWIIRSDGTELSRVTNTEALEGEDPEWLLG